MNQKILLSFVLILSIFVLISCSKPIQDDDGSIGEDKTNDNLDTKDITSEDNTDAGADDINIEEIEIIEKELDMGDLDSFDSDLEDMEI